MSVCLSMCPHGTTLLPLERIFRSIFFENLSRSFECDYVLTRITGTLHEDQYTFLIISRSFLLIMRNISDKSRRENQNTHLVFNDFTPKIVLFVR